MRSLHYLNGGTPSPFPTEPEHYRFHAVSGEKKNLGRVGGQFATSFYTFVDRRGDVWFSVLAQNGELRRVHADTGKIDVYPNSLPPLYRWDKEEIDPSSKHQAERGIMWMQPLDGDRAVFTLGYEGGMLYVFDSTKPIGSGLEFQKIRHIGYSDLGLAMGDRRVFYYQRANHGFGHQGDQASGGIHDFHLLSVSLESSGHVITDHGLLRDQAGRVVWRVPGMMTDGDSRVFLIGDWWTLPGDIGSHRYQYKDGKGSYPRLERGQFFGVADVSR